MSNILRKLQYMEFPSCTKEALQYLITCFSQPSAGIPGFGGATESQALEVAQEYVLHVSRKRGHLPGAQRKLSAIQELQLLEMVCSCLNGAPEESRYRIFSVIFGGHVDYHKASLLTKIVSMAISISCSAVLGCAALWMQEQGSQSQAVCDLAQKLVNDYCLLFPNVSSAFIKLPKVSSLFTCNLITAVSTIYTYTDASKCPPLGLLENITEWISLDPCLCSDSVRLIRIQSNFTCPLSGLVRWCVLGPLIAVQNSHGSDSPSTDTGVVQRLLTVFSKLHLNVLLSLQAYKSMELNEELFRFQDIYVLANALHAINKVMQAEEERLVLQTSIDRLSQIIQVAMVTGSLSEKFDVAKICEILPPSRLLTMITAMQTHRQGVAMEVG